MHATSCATVTAVLLLYLRLQLAAPGFGCKAEQDQEQVRHRVSLVLDVGGKHIHHHWSHV